MSRKNPNSKVTKELGDSRRGLFQESLKHVESMVSDSTMKFVKHMADPRLHPPSPPPAVDAAYGGLCEMVTGKSIFTCYTGTAGVGIALIDPANCAACEDRAIAVSSTLVSSTNNATTIQVVTTSSVNYAAQYPSRTGFTGAGLTGNKGSQLSAAVCATGVYVKPIDSALEQNGLIYMLEVPTHPILSTDSLMTVGDVLNHPRTRCISGVQVASPDFQNVVNWHRQANVSSDDGRWIGPSGVVVNLLNAPLIIVIVGDVATAYNIEVISSWMAKGTRTNPAKPIYVDFPGSQALYNMLLLKRVSGWCGKSDEVVTSYQLALGHAIKKTLPKSVKEEQEARARLDRDKATRPSSSWLVDGIKAVAPIAKQVAGFLL